MKTVTRFLMLFVIALVIAVVFRIGYTSITSEVRLFRAGGAVVIAVASGLIGGFLLRLEGDRT
jgi:hypothetical protein